jgi:hypothetical protein
MSQVAVNQVAPADVFSDVLRFGVAGPLDVLDKAFTVDRRLVTDGHRARERAAKAVSKRHGIFTFLEVGHQGLGFGVFQTALPLGPRSESDPYIYKGSDLGPNRTAFGDRALQVGWSD